MMQRLKKRITLKNNGFMLAEAVLAVFVTLIVVLLLQNLLHSLTSADKAAHRTDDLVFAYVQFNRFLHDEEIKTAYVNPELSNFRQAAVVRVTKTGEKKTYFVTHYQKMIRVTTPEGGHMPLLLGVQAARFSTRDCQLKINVTEKDQRVSELYFKLDPQPKKKVKNNDHKKTTNQKNKSKYLTE